MWTPANKFYILTLHRAEVRKTLCKIKLILMNIRYHTSARHCERSEANQPHFFWIASGYRPRKDGYGCFIAISNSHINLYYFLTFIVFPALPVFILIR
jgi:hypothetical protein